MVAGVLVATLALAGFLVWRSGGANTTHFAATSEVPVSFDYPSHWTPPAQEGIKLVVSPHADEFLRLFNELGRGGSWDGVGQVLRTDRDGAIGMFTTSNQISFDAASLRGALPTILPESMDPNPAWNLARIGDKAALKFTSYLTDPIDGSNRLGYVCYIAPTNEPSPRNVHMIFFADAASFVEHEAEFDRIAQSAVLLG